MHQVSIYRKKWNIETVRVKKDSVKAEIHMKNELDQKKNALQLLLFYYYFDLTKETEKGEEGETGQLHVSTLPLTQCDTVALLRGSPSITQVIK